MTNDRRDRSDLCPEEGDPFEHRFERDAFHPGVARLDRYLSSTHLDAPPGLVEDIGRQLASKPGSSPARRLSSATRARDRVAIMRTLRQALAMALGAGHVRPMMRAQAAGVLIFVLIASGVSSVAGLVGVHAGVEVAGTIARDALAAREARTDRPRADSSAAADRSSSGVTTKRAKAGQPSKGKTIKNRANRPETLPWAKDDDRSEHALKRKKSEKGQKGKYERLEKSPRGKKDKKSQKRKDDRLDKPAKGKKGEKSQKRKDDRLDKSPKGKKDRQGKKSVKGTDGEDTGDETDFEDG